MLTKVKVSIIALVFTLGFAGTPALAQPIVQGGLVNVAINDVNLAVPISLGAALNLAANICGVNVNVLAVQLQGGNTVTCSTGDQDATTVVISKITQQ